MSGCGWPDDGEEAGSTAQTAQPETPTATETEMQSDVRVFEDDVVGYSLSYPRTWRPTGTSLATEFSAGADCRSVQIVDRELPPDAGPGAQVLSSFVQVCSRQLDDGASLEAFLRRTYDDELLARFGPATVGGAKAFRTGTAASSITFLQTDTHRLQVVTAVVADPAQRPQRLAEVEAVLETFSLGP